MKRIRKSQGPNALTKYADGNPKANWDIDFRNDKSGESYKSVRRLMLEDQGGLCGYCEMKILDLPSHQQRVEHYHNKSDDSDSEKNWGLDWNNVFAVCLGGSDTKDQYCLPSNLSCDSHKGHLVQKKKLLDACEGYFLNPMQVVTTPCLFDFDRSNGKLLANKDACSAIRVACDNQYGSMKELVEKTIEVLNLNCARLCDNRLLVLRHYNQAVKRVRDRKDRNGLEKLAEQWFRDQWPSFFTTRRILLGRQAENYLERVGYND